MSTRTAFMFPGQGSFIPGLFTELAHQFPGAARTLEEIDDVCESAGARPVSALLTSRDAPSLDMVIASSPELVDTAIFASNVTANAVLQEAGVVPEVLVGHSFGEMAALTAAGAFNLGDATRLVLQRHALLNAITLPESGMLAVDLDPRRTKHLVGLIDERFLTLALDNAPERCVVSGPREALNSVAAVASSLGVATYAVPAARAFHNPMLNVLEDEVAATFDRVEVRAPKIPVYSSMLRRYVVSVADVREVASVQLTATVHFRESLLRLHADGVRSFIESGAKAVVTSFATDTLPPGSSVIAPFRRRSTSRDISELLSNADQPAGTNLQRVIPAPEPANAVAAEQVATSVEQQQTKLPQLDELFEELRALYAEKLELPEEMLDDDADLEADFGVDSIQQVALFNQARNKYALPEPEGLRVTSYTRLRDVAGLLHSLEGQAR